MTVGEKLLDLRKKKGLSQEEVADILKVSRQTISKWETDGSTPDFEKIVPLCELYEISADELLTGKNNNKEESVKNTKDNSKEKFARNLGIAIGLYIFSIVLIIMFSESFPIIGVSLFLLVIAIATGLIVYNSIKYGSKKENKAKNVNRVEKQICEIISIIGIIVYFVVSFLTMAWHITWVIFLIIGLCKSIAKLILGLKESKENNYE